MQELLDVEGVDRDTCSLLEAAGYTDLNALRSNSPTFIHAELVKANGMLKILAEAPSLDQVSSWCASVALSGGKATAEVEMEDELRASLEMEASQEVEVSKEEPILIALPLSDDFIEDDAVDVAKFPQVIRDSDVNERREASRESTEKSALPKQVESQVKVAGVRRVESAKLDVDKSKLKSLDEYRSSGEAAAPQARPKDGNNVREAKAGTNAGVDPSSEKYIRGVLHNDAQRTYTGAWGQLIACVLLVSSIIPIIYILFQRENYIWGWLAPALAFLAIAVYVILARRSSCPVCRQRQFVPKACRKHVKAHSWPMFGHMIPTAWHLIRYKWFRCIFCGTSIRVKE